MEHTPLLQLAGCVLTLFGLGALCVRLAADLRELVRLHHGQAAAHEHHWQPAVVTVARQSRGAH
ncbi:hypothetical protein ACFONG_06460 [Uliginosibacterium paludis]|uniref:Uncharacterized protein n=1 Tax=Uliginosibacterium paludis TaxID=1615952 RepID=A0ABV2CLG5_9RHOO